MSKSRFARVKYPNNKEIHNQINAIIEQSHLFEIEQNQTGYVQCRRVKKSFFSSNAATFLLAAAACVIVLLCVAPMLNINALTSKAHTNVGEHETSTDNGDAQGATQPSDIVDASKVKLSTSTLVSNAGQLFSVVQSYDVANVTVAGQEVEAIYKYYQNRRIERWQELNMDYVAPQLEQEISSIKDVVAKNSVEKTSCPLSGYIALQSNYVVNQNNVKSDTGVESRLEITDIEVDIFDLKTGQRLTMDNIFKDSKLALDVIAQRIYNDVIKYEQLGVGGITDTYKSKESIKEALISNCSFSLNTNGITIYCNDYRVTEEDYFSTQLTKRNYESFLFEYDNYDIVKDEYRGEH